MLRYRANLSLVLALSIQLVFISSIKAQQVTLQLCDGSGHPGGTVSIGIALDKGDEAVSAVAMDIGFDTGSLSNPRAEMNSQIGPDNDTDRRLISSVVSSGVLRIGIIPGSYTQASLEAVIPDGLVAAVTFDIDPGAPPGITTLANIPSASTSIGQALPTIGAGGMITIRGRIEATVDLTPNTLNLASQGKWLSCYIELSDGYDAADIDPSTVRLQVEYNQIPSEETPTKVGDYDADGISDLMVKFSRQVLIQHLAGINGNVTLTVIGTLSDGTLFGGSDTIEVKAKTTELALLQNYPSPFNPDTWIPYQLPQDFDVTITIYDMTGHLIRTLDLGHKTSGFYTTREKAAHWDGKNEAGEQVSSGVYFYTIQAGDFTATRKMVVVR